MAHLKFDAAKLAKLDDVGRFESLRPDVMWAAIGVADPSTIVELGAGSGLFAARWAALAPSARVYAVDIMPEAIHWMEEHRPEVAGGRLVPTLSQETAVPLEDGIADIVTMINMHHELADPAAMYREVRRLLVPSGRIMMADWAPIDTPKGPPAHLRISASRASDFLAEAGFEEVASHEGLPYHWLVTGTKPE